MTARSDEELLTTTRVLFMHGIEGGPSSFKPNILRSAFKNFSCPQMTVKEGISRSIKKAIIRSAVIMGSSLVSTKILGFSFKLSAGIWILALIVIGLLYKPSKRRTVSQLFQESVELQKKVIKEFKPDIVIGSSWGGAVAVECILNKDWNGPTILLAPASHLVNKNLIHPRKSISIPSNVPCYIFHGTNDTTVPVSDSKELARNSENTKLFILQNETHNLIAFTESHLTNRILELLRSGKDTSCC